MNIESVYSNTKAILFNIQVYVEYKSVNFHKASRETKLYSFRGTDSRSEGSVFHTQLSTPRFPQTESLGLTVVRTENGNYHFYKELSPQ